MSVDDKVKHTGLLTRNKLFDHSVSIPEVLPMVSFAIWCCQNANRKLNAIFNHFQLRRRFIRIFQSTTK